MILVVAPDTAFRLSLRFMLEAEGFDVVVPNRFDDAWRLRGKADCTIVDHDTLTTAGVSVTRLVEEKGPVILLADTLEDMPRAEHLRTIQKPLLGSAVVNAVHTLLEEGNRLQDRALRRYP
ncbi:DNA-binding response regulator [Nitratireductor sp. GISD-1A_MAKvit]|uniref:DNA-binding response regulator n=1 Tax=Nitratireductor sp. GISD-1A_MAKvit TaxID=3234198 RepID=UPI0034656E0E